MELPGREHPDDAWLVFSTGTNGQMAKDWAYLAEPEFR
jgi:hypothetical protein